MVMRCRPTKKHPISMHKKYNVLQYASPSMLYYFYYCCPDFALEPGSGKQRLPRAAGQRRSYPTSCFHALPINAGAPKNTTGANAFFAIDIAARASCVGAKIEAAIYPQLLSTL